MMDTGWQRMDGAPGVWGMLERFFWIDWSLEFEWWA